MAELVQTRTDILVRAILQEGDHDFVCTDYADYRWHLQNVPPPVPYYIFGDTVGIFAFETNPSPKIVSITSPTIASAYREQFDSAWKMAKVPPQNGNKKVRKN